MDVLENSEIFIKNISQLVTVSAIRTNSISNNSAPRKGQGLQELGIIENGAVYLKNGLIQAVGENEQLKNTVELSEKTLVLDCTGKTVLPGFVDPHTHLIFSGTRETELTLKLEGKTYMEILQSGGGILKTVRETRAANINNLVDQGRSRLDKMLEYGTTTVEAKSGYGLELDAEIKSLSAMKKLDSTHPIDIITTFLGAHAIPPEYKNDPDGYLDLVISEMLPRVKSENLAKYCDIFCEMGVFNVTQSKRLLLAAKDLGFELKLHVDEFVPLGGAELAAELGAISADHLAMSTENGLQALAEKGIIGVLLPATPFSIMEKHYPNARKMIDLGLPLALATDLNPNCFTESMQFIISLACYNMKMLPAEAITAATINAAHAVGKAHEVGSIEVGKKADIVIYDIPNFHHIPYHMGVNHVEKVIKNGKLVIDR
jgi:imidazolonepropionase